MPYLSRILERSIICLRRYIVSRCLAISVQGVTYLWDPLENDNAERIVKATLTPAKATITMLGIGCASLIEVIEALLDSTKSTGWPTPGKTTWRTLLVSDRSYGRKKTGEMLTDGPITATVTQIVTPRPPVGAVWQFLEVSVPPSALGRNHAWLRLRLLEY
jgi:hypothetical protein